MRITLSSNKFKFLKLHCKSLELKEKEAINWKQAITNNLCDSGFRGGNGLARKCRSWRVGRESQRWSGSGSGGSGGNGSRDSNRSEKKTGKGWSLEKEIRSSSSSSFYPSRSWWWKTWRYLLAIGKNVDGVTVGPNHLRARRKREIGLIHSWKITF